jgi:hypothetical protein
MYRYNRNAIIYANDTNVDETTYKSRYVDVVARLVALQFKPINFNPHKERMPPRTEFDTCQEDDIDEKTKLWDLIWFAQEQDVTIAVHSWDEISSPHTARMLLQHDMSVLAIDRLTPDVSFVEPDDDGWYRKRIPIVRHFDDNIKSLDAIVAASDAANQNPVQNQTRMEARQQARQMYPEMVDACQTLHTSNLGEIIDYMTKKGFTAPNGGEIRRTHLLRWAERARELKNWQELLNGYSVEDLPLFSKQMYPEMVDACQTLQTSNLGEIIDYMTKKGFAAPDGGEIKRTHLKSWAKHARKEKDWQELLNSYNIKD